MRLVAAAMVVVCLLAACGKSSSEKANAPRATAKEQAYANKLRSLCIQAARSDAAAIAPARTIRAQRRAVARAIDDYARFVDSLGRLDAPPTLTHDHRSRVVTARRMLRQLDAVRASIAGADEEVLRTAYRRVVDAYGADDRLDARSGLVDCIEVPGFSAPTDAYPPVTGGSLARLRGFLNRICIDNASRTVYARKLGGAAARERIDEAAAERLSRLVGAIPRPTDTDARYTGWTDSLRSRANLLRLASDADGDKANALIDQARRVDAASRRTAARLGLSACAEGDAAAVTGR